MNPVTIGPIEQAIINLVAEGVAARFGIPAAAATTIISGLVRFGHLGISAAMKTLDIGKLIGAVRAAIMSYERYAGLAPTGNPTMQLERLMRQRRCSCPDLQHSVLPTTYDNLVRQLTYRVDGYVSGLSQADQDDLLQQAADSWSAVANVQLTRVSNMQSAHISIRTGQGPADQFDGPGGTLAYANLGPITTETAPLPLLLVFDLDETWLSSVGNPGVLFLNVAAHELGHILGLTHSQISTALMAPYYNESVGQPQQEDDIPRVQACWGQAATFAGPVDKKTLEITISANGTITGANIASFK